MTYVTDRVGDLEREMHLHDLQGKDSAPVITYGDNTTEQEFNKAFNKSPFKDKESPFVWQRAIEGGSTQAAIGN